MTSEELDAIEARANASTVGPWSVFYGLGIDMRRMDAQGGIAQRMSHITVKRSHPRARTDCGVIGHRATNPDPDADLQFIAHARTDIPALIVRVRELESVINVTISSMRNIGLDTSADVLEMALTKGATK